MRQWGRVRSALWLAFFGVILWAWWQLFAMSTGMGLDLLGRPNAMAEAMRRMDPRMDMPMPMAEFWPLFAMWALMMAAMMLPTLVPTLRTYDDLIATADGTRAGWLGVLAGYALVWIGMAALFAGVQQALLFAGVIDMLGIATSRWIGAALLVATGAFQFTRLKAVCHGLCHSPMMYFLGHWRPGGAGGLRMGLGLGAFCAICCWGFMALGFVGGVMSLAWMGIATLLMIVEKLPQIGHYILKPVGAVLILAGFVLAAWPLIAGA
jgi:predicted metal-binding membrane protein